ncbi:MAG: fibronectin type III domain-containing protein [Saprospiraceae bacterium]|nr:fibronectin type III domain-containing protein [Saprospiraceae bacterium]
METVLRKEVRPIHGYPLHLFHRALLHYLEFYATTSCNNTSSGYGTSYAFTTSTNSGCITPGSPVAVSGIATGLNSANLDWSAGNPAGSPTVTYYWVIGTNPSVTYGNGVAQGSTTNTWLSTSSLSPGTSYYLRVYATTSCNNTSSGYGTSYAFTTNSNGGCATPTIQSTTITFSLVSTQQFTAIWIKGNGEADVS